MATLPPIASGSRWTRPLRALAAGDNAQRPRQTSASTHSTAAGSGQKAASPARSSTGACADRERTMHSAHSRRARTLFRLPHGPGSQQHNAQHPLQTSASTRSIDCRRR